MFGYLRRGNLVERLKLVINPTDYSGHMEWNNRRNLIQIR